MAYALSIVQRLFPDVTKIVDAKKDSVIEVTKSDTKSATVRNHKACAMAVAREIVAFDRNAEFAPGTYRLAVPPISDRLGKVQGTIPAKGGSRSGNLIKRFQHKTEGIRSSLGSKDLV